MLPKDHRLKKQADFSAVYAKGFFGAANGISIKYLETKNKFTRLGFPVGKNFSKKAVERNRIRRVLREACSEFFRSLKPGFDIVVMIRPGNKSIGLPQASATLEKIFKKNNLFK